MSAGYSSIALLGYLGHDPEMVRAERGTRGARFSVAVNRAWRDESGNRQKETDWYRVIAGASWRKPASAICPRVGLCLLPAGRACGNGKMRKESNASRFRFWRGESSFSIGRS